MVKVSVIEPLHVAATGTTYEKGKQYEITEALYKKYKGKHFKEVSSEAPTGRRPAVKK